MRQNAALTALLAALMAPLAALTTLPFSSYSCSPTQRRSSACFIMSVSSHGLSVPYRCVLRQASDSGRAILTVSQRRTSRARQAYVSCSRFNSFMADSVELASRSTGREMSTSHGIYYNLSIRAPMGKIYRLCYYVGRPADSPLLGYVFRSYVGRLALSMANRLEPTGYSWPPFFRAAGSGR